MSLSLDDSPHLKPESIRSLYIFIIYKLFHSLFSSFLSSLRSYFSCFLCDSVLFIWSILLSILSQCPMTNVTSKHLMVTLLLWISLLLRNCKDGVWSINPREVQHTREEWQAPEHHTGGCCVRAHHPHTVGFWHSSSAQGNSFQGSRRSPLHTPCSCRRAGWRNLYVHHWSVVTTYYCSARRLNLVIVNGSDLLFWIGDLMLCKDSADVSAVQELQHALEEYLPVVLGLTMKGFNFFLFTSV